jgi:thioester reductase-like protein
MSTTQLQPAQEYTSWLIALVAEQLDVPAKTINPHVPLVRYGLDSLAAVQVASAIAERMGCDVLDPLLLDRPDISSLARYLDAACPSAPAEDESVSTEERMLADSVLPADIRPCPHGPTAPGEGTILLTGATGFLGAYLLRTLLVETPAHVYCLVRAGKEDAGERIRHNLESYGIWQPSFAGRIVPLAGDLARPALGLAPRQFEEQSERIEAIYHAGASVSWVFPYEGLRDVNVAGTAELLRLACRGRCKPLHFVSSLAVCCSSNGPAEISERDDVFAHRAGLHLGYAQSKCVAEALVSQAGQRGLPVTIHRPSLLVGDSRSGAASPEDFLARLIRGCVRMRAAPDLDWALDCCPVDHAARAIVALARERRRPGHVFHLAGLATRSWREVVLWMNLFGYPVRLLPYRSWLQRLQEQASTPDHPLHLLRTFFARPVTAEGLTVPELYEERRRPRIGAASTRRCLARLGLDCPGLQTRHLERIFGHFIEGGVLPAVPQRRTVAEEELRLDRGFFEGMVRRLHGDDRLRVRRLTRLPRGRGQSLITEVTSWRQGASVGLARYRVEWDGGLTPATLDVFVKQKPEDRVVMEAGERLAAACSEELGAAFGRWKHRTGLAGCHLRELALYRLADERIRRHTPAVFGIVQEDSRCSWALILEDVSGLLLLDAEEGRGWERCHIEAAVAGLAEVHAVGYGREANPAEPWLGAVFSAAGMEEMGDLWQALADHAGPYFTAWAGPEVRTLQRELLARVGRWWRELEQMPRTLLHGDFNPRNLALRRVGARLRLCAYDWELATLGAPQHDLAELLCFALSPMSTPEEVSHYLECHRHPLERATGRAIDAAAWRRGFQLSLCDLLINRLPMYCLIHPFRPQKHLERVVQTWRRLYESVSW